MSGQFDLTVVGADVPGLCAAACAARRGFRVSLVKKPGKTGRRSVALDAIPNNVWRRLNLQNYDIALASTPQIATLFPDGKVIALPQSPRQAAAILADDEHPDHHVWRDFASALDEFVSVFDRHSDEIAHRQIGHRESADPLTWANLLTVSQSCDDVLADHLDDDDLRTHVAAAALSVSGLGGREQGSAAALAGVFSESAWPAHRVNGAVSLERILERVCADAKVVINQGQVARVSGLGEKYRLVHFSGGDTVETRFLLFPSPRAAQQARARPQYGGADTALRAARATLRLKLSDEAPPPIDMPHTVYQIAEDLDGIQEAREAVCEGRLPAAPPLQFSYASPFEIIIETSYCPDRLVDDGEVREWTGQDKQALTAQLIDRLADRIDNLSGRVVQSKLEIEGAWSAEDDRMVFDDPNVFFQTASRDAVRAAVRLTDRILDGY